MSAISTANYQHQSTIRILHVDDDTALADLTATFLTREDDRFVIETAHNVSDGLEQLTKADFDCIVSDYDMPGQNGIEFLKAVREEYPDFPFILFTGKGSEEVASDAISAGVSDYLQKGSGTDRYSLLANRINNLVSQHRAKSQLDAHADQQRCIADLGREALDGAPLETLFDRAAEIVADTLDNEYAKVLEYRPEHEDLLLRSGVGWRDGLVGKATVGTDDDSQAGHTIRSEEPIVVDDLRTEDRFRGPPLLVEHDVVSGVSVIMGSPDDPWGVLGTHTTAQKNFTDDDITFVQNISHVLANAIERSEHEQELQRKERRYQAVFNDPNILVGLIDTEGTVFDINQTAIEYIDAPLDDVIDTPFWETPWFDHSEVLQNEVRGWVNRAASGEYVEFETDLVRPNGDLYTIEGVFRPVMNDDGEVISLLISAQDISTRKERERDLEVMTRRLEAILDNTTTPMFMKDDEGRHIFVNQGYRDLFGLEDEDIVGRTDSEVHPPAVADQLWENDRLVLNRGEAVESEERVVVDGTERTFLSTKVPIYDTGDRSDPEQPVAVFGVASDITELKEREHRLSKTTSRLEVLFDNSPDMIEVLDSEGRLRDVNHRFCEELGYDEDEVLDRPIWEIDQLFDAEDVRSLLSDFALDERRKFEGFYERRDGSTFPVEVHLRRLDIEGESRFIAISRDITERKHREQELTHQNDRLEQFASIVSHDLRNPLTVAEGRLALANEECDSKHLDTVARAHDRMNALIDDLLLLARHGEEVGDIESVNLVTLTENCWQNVATAGATLKADVTRPVRADKSRLQQLFENLYRNAIEHGGVDVTVTIGEIDSGFYVEDDGPGIPIDEQGDVFKAGYSTAEDGTGFGLSIVKQVADAHGWNVRVTDGSDGGARFEFTGVTFAAE